MHLEDCHCLIKVERVAFPGHTLDTPASLLLLLSLLPLLPHGGLDYVVCFRFTPHAVTMASNY